MIKVHLSGLIPELLLFSLLSWQGEISPGMMMYKIFGMAAVAVLVLLALLGAAGFLAAQNSAGSGAMVSAGGAAGQALSGGGVSVGPGGAQTFSLGSGFMYSMMSIGADEASKLQQQGVRTITVPAGQMVYVTSSTGQPMSIDTRPDVTPNTIVFGPGGLAGVGAWAGPGTGAWAGPAGVVASAGGTGVSVGTGPAGTGVFVGTGPGGTGVSVGTGTGLSMGAGPGGSMQMYSFTGSPGQAFLVTQQSGGTMDRVLVVFQ
jgi:hypothetical protein